MKTVFKRLGILMVLALALSALLLVSCGSGGLDGATLENKTVTYDGAEHSLEVSGAPDGATVTYTPAGPFKDAGEYDVTAKVELDGKSVSLTAKLVIEKKTLGVTWDLADSYGASGSAPEIKYTLDGVVSGDDVKLSFDYGDYDFSKAKSKVAVSVAPDSKNYQISAENSALTLKFVLAEYTVSFDPIVDREVEPQTVKHGKTAEEPIKFSRTGYEFGGWYLGDKQWNFEEDEVTSDITLTAKWIPSVYTIKYYTNGGVNDPRNPSSFTVESTDTLKPPTKEGCVFLGWFEDKDFIVPAKNIGSNRKHLTLYAKWAEYSPIGSVSADKLDSANATLLGDVTAVTGNFKYVFVAEVDSFVEGSVLYLGRGFDTTEGSYVKITHNQIVTVVNGVENQIISDPRGHVRNFVGYVVVEVTVSQGVAKVILHTGDGEANATALPWEGKNGEIFAKIENAEFSSASLGWYTVAYDYPVWVVGDDSVGVEYNYSWLGRAEYHGYEEFLSIGAAGLNAASALDAFEAALGRGTPKFAIWAFSKESGTEYEAALNDFVTLCAAKRITPILTTFSTKLSPENEAKNAAVISSGRRYIDFASVSDYSGIFENGKYTDLGAETMFAKLLVDFPELICAAAPIRTVEAETLPAIISSGSGAPAGALSLSENVIKDGKYLVFSAKLDGALKDGQIIKVGHGHYESSSTWLEITPTTVMAYSYYGYNDPPLANSLSGGPKQHGLTIKNYVTVIITKDNDDMGSTATIVTDGGYYTIKRGEGLSWGGEMGKIFGFGYGVELTDAKLTWVCKDYTKDVWIIGDSYLGTGNSQRWPYYMYNEPYQNALMVGYAGMQSKVGLRDFKDALQYETPKYLVWCMGMNDGDKNGEINSSYLACVTEVLALCKEHDIVPVIATIPTCLAVDNSVKNFAINNKLYVFADYDYRVVDFARAVDGYADKDNASWYDGMLYKDNVHPDTLGAKALYMQFFHDFPEIAGGWNSTVYEEKISILNSGASLTINATEELKNEKVFSFTADFSVSKFAGTLTIGNGDAKTEGSTFVTIDESNVKVHQIIGGSDVVIKTEPNSLKLDDLITVKIHVKGDKATIKIQSTGEKTSLGNKLYTITTDWTTVGKAFASIDGMQLSNASLKWYTC